MSNLLKSRLFIQSASDLTKNQKLAFNALLLIAKKQLDENMDKTVFTTTFAGIKEIIGSEKKINNADLGRNLDGLTTKGIILNFIENNEYEYRNAIGILSEIKTTKNYDVEFILPPTIRRNIIMPKMFCPFDLKLEARLSSGYSITIYEYCKDYIKVEIPKIEISTFKKLLGIEGGYDRIFDIRHKVIEKSIKEINEKTDITITDYELIKEGKKMKYVKFWAVMKDNPPPTVENEGNGGWEGTETAEELPEEIGLIPASETLTTKQKKELKGFVSKYGSELVKSNILYTNKQNYTKYYSYLKKAITEDYAESDRLKEEERKANIHVEASGTKQAEDMEHEKEAEKAAAIEIYNALKGEEKKAIEAAAEAELAESEGTEYLKKVPTAYEAVKRKKIAELTKLKYGIKIKSPVSALTDTRPKN